MNHEAVFMQRIVNIIGLFFTLCLIIPNMVRAQVQLPEFSISSIPTLDNMSQDSFDYERAFSNIKNTMMADTLRLQYQINLLERLIRRQTEIQRIAESYQGVGIPFRQPAPPATACTTLPANVLCMAFYPESARYKAMIEERREEARREQLRQMEAMLSEYNLAAADNQDSDDGVSGETGGGKGSGKSTVASDPDPDYTWSDIRCLSGKCSALLESVSDETLRYRIRLNDELPDGSKVIKISASGIDVTKSDKNFNLRPKGMAAPQPSRGRAVSEILQNQFGTDSDSSKSANAKTAGSSSLSAISDAAIPPQNILDDALGAGLPSLPPLLGPTGLF